MREHVRTRGIAEAKEKGGEKRGRRRIVWAVEKQGAGISESLYLCQLAPTLPVLLPFSRLTAFFVAF